MSERRVILGPYTEGVLVGLDNILNDEKYLQVLQRLDLTNLFYTCLLQNGAEHFDLFTIEGDSRLIPSSKYLSNRLSILEFQGKRDADIRDAVLGTFDSLLPFDWMFSKQYVPVHSLVNFLEELFIATRMKRSIVTLLPIPTASELQSLVPPELLLAIENLLSCLQSHEVSGPAPKTIIPVKKVQQFQELIDSDVFHQFALAHSQLESQRVNTDDAKARIQETGEKVVQRFKWLVKSKKLLLGVLTVTPELVSTIFGPLGGALAKLTSSELAKIIAVERRIVIYDMLPTLDRLVADRRAQFARAGKR